MKIAVRLDDITPDMDWVKFNRFKELMDRYYVKPLIGVVPLPEDKGLSRGEARSDFWPYVLSLRDELGWEIAMHGLHHVYTTKRGGMFPLNHQSEFAGIPYEKQRKMIEIGKKVLADHAIVTDIFMAPSHTYDSNTLKALRENGFTRMTDGFGKLPYLYDGITFYPVAFRQHSSLHKKDGVTTFVVHCNTLDEKDFARYEKIFQEQQMLPYRELLYYRPVKRGIGGRMIERAMASAKRMLVSAGR